VNRPYSLYRRRINWEFLAWGIICGITGALLAIVYAAVTLDWMKVYGA
jgi:cell division protein FtsX